MENLSRYIAAVMVWIVVVSVTMPSLYAPFWVVDMLFFNQEMGGFFLFFLGVPIVLVSVAIGIYAAIKVGGFEDDIL